MRKSFILIAMMAMLGTAANARTLKVLFIGNSYIFTNNIPGMLEQLALSMGDTLEYEESTFGGYTLEQHCKEPGTLAKIKSKKWDIVVLQEQSQKPSFSPGQVAAETYPYAKTLDSLVIDNDSCTETMFYMTWGRKNGDASNCAVYPPVCTYEGMQQRLRESYLEMAKDNKAVTAPVGATWKVVRDSLPNIDLYNPDESHPSVHGAYLAACVFYASMFHKNPHGSSYNASLSATDAERLQYFSGKVVLDSLNQWQQYGNYPYAAFSYSVNNNTVTFQNLSLKGDSYSWSFGDATNSSQTNPVKTYTQQGKYEVRLKVTNKCFSETRVDSVTVGPVGIANIEQKYKALSYYQPEPGVVQFTITGEGHRELAIYSSNGQLVLTREITTSKNLKEQLAPGIYIYMLSGTSDERGKIVVY